MSRKRTKTVYFTDQEKEQVERAVDHLYDGHGEDIPTGLGVAQIAQRFLEGQ